VQCNVRPQSQIFVFNFNQSQKPDNIGFNSEGELKMFDFGLAKRITNADKAEDDLYNLTGNTGSLRYMAPEVVSNYEVILYLLSF
jgi:serine/threonine protein kinase